jgi:hypothetical protein
MNGLIGTWIVRCGGAWQPDVRMLEDDLRGCVTTSRGA